MPELPRLDDSLLVRTDFTSDDVWREVCDQALREHEDSFRAYLEPVSDPAFDGATWLAVRAAMPANADGASVLFIAASTALAAPDHPVLVVDLLDDGKRPFRCIPTELWAVENNLNISNMVGGIRGRDRRERGVPRSPPITPCESRGLASDGPAADADVLDVTGNAQICRPSSYPVAGVMITARVADLGAVLSVGGEAPSIR